jgi:energy-coupling factor transporter ATP-binding protein EcfA2
MVKQSIKKRDGIQKKSISDFKKNFGFGGTSAGSITAKNADKEMQWLVMPKGFQDALKLPGIPMGYVTGIAGHSNVGKSTLVNHIITAAQHTGNIPVIFDTENNFDFQYAKNCGFSAEPVYGDVEVEKTDEETGEITIVKERKIIDYEGEFIYFNSAMLAQKYGNYNYSNGKEEKIFRKEAVIEDVAHCVNDLIKAQDIGEITQGLVFVWDSIGTLDCFRSTTSSCSSNLWNAGAMQQSFNQIFNDKIPRTRKIDCPYTNTFVFVNKVWMDNMTNPVGPASLELKGGSATRYSARLIIILGNMLKAGIKKLTAVSKGETYNYGIQVKIQVIKNQLPSPFSVTYQNSVCCTEHGMIGVDELDDYRKKYASEIIKQLNDICEKNGKDSPNITEDDLQFSEEEGEE